MEAASPSAAVSTAGAHRARRLVASKPRYGEAAIRVVLFACALVSVVTTIGIVVALASPTIDFFREVSIWDYFTGTRWAPLFKPQDFGVLPLVVGTLVTYGVWRRLRRR